MSICKVGSHGDDLDMFENVLCWRGRLRITIFIILYMGLWCIVDLGLPMRLAHNRLVEFIMLLCYCCYCWDKNEFI